VCNRTSSYPLGQLIVASTMSSTRDIQVKQQRDGVSWCQWAAAPCFQLSVNEMSGYCLHVTSTRRLRENYWLIVPVIDSTDITSTSARPRRTDAAAKYSIHVASFNCFITRHTGQFGDDLMTRLYSVIALKDIVSQPPSRVNPTRLSSVKGVLVSHLQGLIP